MKTVTEKQVIKTNLKYILENPDGVDGISSNDAIAILKAIQILCWSVRLSESIKRIISSFQLGESWTETEYFIKEAIKLADSL